MAGYLEGYGAGDERRERVVKRIVVSVLAAVVAVIVLYFVFRTYPAKHQVEAFLAALEKGDYQSAYRLWGCSEPCRDYSFDKFIEDWGPKGNFGSASSAKVKRARYCETGVIVTVNSPKGADVPLWYERKDGTLGFAPWPVCAPHIPAPAAAP